MEVQIIAVIMKLLNHSVTPEVPIFLRSQYFFGFQAHTEYNKIFARKFQVLVFLPRIYISICGIGPVATNIHGEYIPKDAGPDH